MQSRPTTLMPSRVRVEDFTIDSGTVAGYTTAPPLSVEAQHRAVDYDAELQLHSSPLFNACTIRSHDHVLDIGCGAGRTTCDAARQAAAGTALGIDISAPMLARARALAASEGLPNVRFEQGDAQTRSFPPEHFDLAMSRYGTMFFADPIAGFRNIRTALKSGGRLSMLVWQEHELNEWSVAIHQALTPHTSPLRAQHFSLEEPATVERILNVAGFADVTFIDLCEPVYYGNDVDAAMEWVKGFRYVRDLLQPLDDDASMRVSEKLRETMTRHLTDNGVWFAAREWIVMAEAH